MEKTLLICTVGGSHQPILKAIEHICPDFICFLCTGRDTDTERSGSEQQITGKGSVIASRRGEPPDLPNIPAQANLTENQYEIIALPADDLDPACVRIRQALADLAQRYPGAHLIADYTGGTKTMSAALVIAALEAPGVELQLITGSRADLSAVAADTEYPLRASTESIRLQRAMQPYIYAWRRYAYDEAQQGLAGVPVPLAPELRGQLNLLRSLSRAFAAWDRFDHASALECLQIYRQRIGATHGSYLNALKIMTGEKQQGREALRLYDLWLNARRRAAQGRYDDAVARVYRLIEWTAQWQLQVHRGIDTADVDMTLLPPGIDLSRDPRGRYQAGLFNAWQIIAQTLDGPCAEFIQGNAKILLTHLELRNNSILAHGFVPVDAGAWRRVEDWLLQAFVPMLEQLVRADGGLHFDLAALQLPRQPLLACS